MHQRLRTGALLALLGFGFVIDAAASPADPDLGFGTGGTTSITSENQFGFGADMLIGLTRDSSDRIYVMQIPRSVPGSGAATLFYRFTRDGLTDSTFGTNGILSALLSLQVQRGFTVDERRGEIVVLGGTDSTAIGAFVPAVQRIPIATGMPSEPQFVFYPLGTYDSGIVEAADVQADGDLVVMGSTTVSRRLFYSRLHPDGSTVGSFADGNGTGMIGDGTTSGVAAVRHDGNGGLYYCASSSYSPTAVMGVLAGRLDASGKIIDSFDPDGYIYLQSGTPAGCLTLEPRGNGNFTVATFSTFVLQLFGVSANSQSSATDSGTLLYDSASTLRGVAQSDGKLVMANASTTSTILSRVAGSSSLRPMQSSVPSGGGTSVGGGGGGGGGGGSFGGAALLALLSAAGWRQRRRRRPRG